MSFFKRPPPLPHPLERLERAIEALQLQGAKILATIQDVQTSEALELQKLNLLVPAITNLLAALAQTAQRNAQLAQDLVTAQANQADPNVLATIKQGLDQTSQTMQAQIDAITAALAANPVVPPPPASVPVPNVVGLAAADANTALVGAGFVVSVISAPDPVILSGVVVSQAPAAGVSAVVGSTVAITVSSGPAVTPVP